MIDDKMKNIIDTIINAKSKVMYFCTAGKNRTGVVSALIIIPHRENIEQLLKQL